MKVLLLVSILGFAQENPDVVLRIFLHDGVSSDRATICRVQATNYSGHSIAGATLGFEALALENGIVVERERGRFGGILANGETAETLIGFNGVFRSFEVVAAPVPAGARSRRGGGGRRRGASPKRRAAK